MEHSRILIDTSIIIDYLRNPDKQSTKFIRLFKKYEISISVITVFELLNGATTEDKFKEIEKIYSKLNILDFDLFCAHKASEIYRDLRHKNKMIDFRDILIGATSIHHKLHVATLNKKHFERLPVKIIE